VEPDPAIRESIRTLLTGSGFTVTTAGTEREAARTLITQAGGFGLAVIEQTLGVMDGIVTLHALVRIRPNLPVVLLTDGTDPGIPEDLQPNVRACLARPFTNDQLLAAVQEAGSTRDSAPSA